MINTNNPKTGKPWTADEIIAELDLCKDPVYYYQNDWQVNGLKPILTTRDERLLREFDGEKIIDEVITEQNPGE